MRKKSNAARIVLLVVAILLAGAWGFLLFKNFTFYQSHIFFQDQAYAKDLTSLDLRGQTVSEAEYKELQTQLPGCEILWDVPLPDGRFPCTAEELTLTNLTEGTRRMLSYFPKLNHVDASGCTNLNDIAAFKADWPDMTLSYVVSVDGESYPNDADTMTIRRLTEEDLVTMDYLPGLTAVNAQECSDYDMLLKLQQARPDLSLSYNVPLLGQSYPNDTKTLSLSDPSLEELKAQLPYLTQLESVDLGASSASPEALRSLQEAFPEKNIKWNKTILGQNHSSEDVEFDFSGMTLTLEEVEKEMKYFPKAEKVILSDCGFENETLAAFREKMRPEYKVVWTVIVTGEKVRTDDTIFHSSGRHVSLVDELSNDLYYCEDMIVVDIGHSQVKYVEWVKGMPNLKYLILADNWIKDITPLSTCKNLVYLELFINPWFDDISPLVGCTALEDLSVADTHVDVKPLAQMPWLKNLWVNNVKMSAEDRQLLTESLPNTHIEFDHGFTTGGGWRQLQNYFDMRDLMGLPYNAW